MIDQFQQRAFCVHENELRSQAMGKPELEKIERHMLGCAALEAGKDEV